MLSGTESRTYRQTLTTQIQCVLDGAGLLGHGYKNFRPKSARNHCVIKVFGGVFVLSRCYLDFSVGVGAFVIGLSQIFSSFSIYGTYMYASKFWIRHSR